MKVEAPQGPPEMPGGPKESSQNAPEMPHNEPETPQNGTEITENSPEVPLSPVDESKKDKVVPDAEKCGDSKVQLSRIWRQKVQKQKICIFLSTNNEIFSPYIHPCEQSPKMLWPS